MADAYEIEIDATAEGAAALESIDKTAGAIEEKFAAINRQLDEMFGYIDAIGGKVTDVGATLRTALSTLSADVGLAKMREWTSTLREFTDEVIRLGDQLETKVIPNMETFIDLVSKSGGPAEPWSTKLPLFTEDDAEFEKEIGKIGLAVAPYYNKLREEGTTAPTGTDTWEWIQRIGAIASALSATWIALEVLAAVSPAAIPIIAGIGSSVVAAYGGGYALEKLTPGGEDIFEDYFGSKTLGRLSMGSGLGVLYAMVRLNYDYITGKKDPSKIMEGTWQQDVFDWQYNAMYGNCIRAEEKKRGLRKGSLEIRGGKLVPVVEKTPSISTPKPPGAGYDMREEPGWLGKWARENLPPKESPGTEVGDYWGKKWVREMFPGLGAGEGTLGAGESAYTGGALPGYIPQYLSPDMRPELPPGYELPTMGPLLQPGFLPLAMSVPSPRFVRPTETTHIDKLLNELKGYLSGSERAGFSQEDLAYSIGALARVYGGEGGAGGAGRTTTAYLTIEKVDINTTEKVDADSLIEMVRNIYNIEADTLS